MFTGRPARIFPTSTSLMSDLTISSDGSPIWNISVPASVELMPETTISPTSTARWVTMPEAGDRMRTLSILLSTWPSALTAPSSWVMLAFASRISSSIRDSR